MRVTARARRSGDWWAVDVPELPGVFTQARRLEHIPDLVRDAVSLLEHVEADTIEVAVEPLLDEATVADLAEARSKRERAAALEREASESIASLARRLTQSGLTLRDTGVVLGVSHQRVAQLLGRSAATSALQSPRD